MDADTVVNVVLIGISVTALTSYLVGLWLLLGRAFPPGESG